jgi:hypothetical protein
VTSSWGSRAEIIWLQSEGATESTWRHVPGDRKMWLSLLPPFLDKVYHEIVRHTLSYPTVCVWRCAKNNWSGSSPIFTKLVTNFVGLPKSKFYITFHTYGHYFAGNYRLSLPVGSLIILMKSTRPNTHAQRSNGGEWQRKFSDKIMNLQQVRSYDRRRRLVRPPPGSGAQGVANVAEKIIFCIKNILSNLHILNYWTK